MPGPIDWIMEMLRGGIPAQGAQILQGGQQPQGGGGYNPGGVASSGPGIMQAPPPPIQRAIMQSPAGADRNNTQEDYAIARANAMQNGYNNNDFSSPYFHPTPSDEEALQRWYLRLALANRKQ